MGFRRGIVIVGLVGLAACSNGGDSDSGALTTSERKYCTLVKQFKEHLPDIPKDSDPDLFIAKMSDAMQKGTGYFNDLLAAAPSEIKPDVEKAIAALQRVAGGDITAYDGLDLTKADEWEESHCNR